MCFDPSYDVQKLHQAADDVIAHLDADPFAVFVLESELRPALARVDQIRARLNDALPEPKPVLRPRMLEAAE